MKAARAGGFFHPACYTGPLMYRFLMVDDEEIVRRGLKRKIDWKNLGFEFLPPCADGREAIDAIERLHPHVVMTDIYMPHMDGLAVAAYAAEHHPGIVVIILSGYDEFEYAQKAIRTKVFDYVLKPVNSRDLIGLLVKLKARLDADCRMREDESALKLRAEAGEALLRTQGILDLISAASSAPKAERFASLFGFSPETLSCAALVAEIESPGSRESLANAVSSAVKDTRRTLRFSAEAGREGLLVFEQDSQTCARISASIGGRIASTPGVRVTVGIGRAYENWLDACRTYEEARTAFAYRLVSGAGGTFHYTQAREDDPESIAELKSRAYDLCRTAVSGEDTGSKAEAYLAGLRDAGLSAQRIRNEIGALFSSILDALGGIGVSAAAVSRELGIDYDRSVEDLKDSGELKALLSRLSSFAGSVLDARNLHAPEWKVLDFKEYVARHYGEELSMQKVAEALSISPSYLSKLAKRYLECSFVDYVTGYRLERAKELLSASDLMTHEVAEKVGYPDSRYFSSLFRKRVGMTPSKYRNDHRRSIGTA
jgi:two-component system response regulator YesN